MFFLLQIGINFSKSNSNRNKQGSAHWAIFAMMRLELNTWMNLSLKNKIDVFRPLFSLLLLIYAEYFTLRGHVKMSFFQMHPQTALSLSFFWKFRGMWGILWLSIWLWLLSDRQWITMFSGWRKVPWKTAAQVLVSACNPSLLTAADVSQT